MSNKTVKKDELKEYSKKVVRLMIILWFVGAIFGAAIIIVEVIATLVGVDGYSAAITIHLPELLTYIGAPMGCGVTGYLLKSAFENKEKIKKGRTEEFNYESQAEIDIP